MVNYSYLFLVNQQPTLWPSGVEDEKEFPEGTIRRLSPADKRTVRRIIFDHFDYIVTEWNKFQEGKNE